LTVRVIAVDEAIVCDIDAVYVPALPAPVPRAFTVSVVHPEHVRVDPAKTVPVEHEAIVKVFPLCDPMQDVALLISESIE
jgi:hypothetical protein